MKLRIRRQPPIEKVFVYVGMLHLLKILPQGFSNRSFLHQANGVFWKISSRESIWSFSATTEQASGGDRGGRTVVAPPITIKTVMINPACSRIYKHTTGVAGGAKKHFGPLLDNYHYGVMLCVFLF